MVINKAIKKQRKSFHRFVLLMVLVFLSLPLLMLILKEYNLYLIAYLIIIEIAICIAIVLRLNNEIINVKDEKYRLLIKNGIFKANINLPCDKVTLVHSLEEGQDWSILLVINSQSRNKNYQEIDDNFYKRCSAILVQFDEIKRQHPEETYSYLIISTNSIRKYELLNTIYKCCVGGVFTGSAIEKIKQYRN